MKYLSILLILIMTGCGTMKLHHTDYNNDGSLNWETKVSYCRLFNQSLDGLEIINPLFTAKLEEQEANNDEAIESVGKATGNIVGSAVGAIVK